MQRALSPAGLAAAPLGMLAMLATLAMPEPARAANPPSAPASPAAPAPADEPGPDEGETRAPAPDERTGHVLFGVAGTAMGPAGSMGPNTPSTSLTAAGFGVGGYVGVGVGRHVSLHALGDWTKLLPPGTCESGCSGTSYSFGLGLTYHLAQGIAFDPWASYGIAYRASSFTIADPRAPLQRIQQAYQGIDIARIALGGEFYPAPFFGFGPFLQLDLGTNFRRPTPLVPLPTDVTDSARAYALFQVGVRISFDPMRRASSPAPQKQARTPLAPAF